jgi:tRNA nucleotidyltransferase (CCA-adding enzyme)
MPSALEWPKPIGDLAQQLEDQGIATWLQGEGLLAALRPPPRREIGRGARHPTRSLVCEADAATVLEALPRAVVTAQRARRITQATESGPVDLIPLGSQAIEARLPDFGLAPFAFAFRPRTAAWCDPIGARASFEAGRLAPARLDPNPFERAPRRFWIAARMLAEYALDPTAELLALARAALPEALDRLPEAAPARRQLERILAAPAPENGLAWLRESGVSTALFPGLDPAGETRIGRLAPIPALRWAVWLHGAGIQRALVRLRMPVERARDIERIHQAHPVDRRIESMREAGVRRILQRLDPQEIEGVFAWRRLELETGHPDNEARARLQRLDAIEARIAALRAHRARSGRVRQLALDGGGVMEALGAGPGPHVGRALAHLARFVESHPEANEREALERELRAWAAGAAEDGH